jgi:hypothetical protein
MNRRTLKYRFSVTLTTIALTVIGGLLTTNGQQTQNKLPPGNWTLSAGPYSGAGYESVPVDVFSVTTNVGGGLTVTSVSLLNRSSKDVSSVKLHWYLKEETQSQVLLEGDTQLIDVEVLAGKEQVLSFPVVSFARVSKSLLKGGNLAGNYRLEIAVSEVNYADASASSVSNKRIFQRAAYKSPAQTDNCQHQGCVYNATRGSYICGADQGTFCSVSNLGQSCTESRCPAPRPNTN